LPAANAVYTTNYARKPGASFVDDVLLYGTGITWHAERSFHEERQAGGPLSHAYTADVSPKSWRAAALTAGVSFYLSAAAAAVASLRAYRPYRSVFLAQSSNSAKSIDVCGGVDGPACELRSTATSEVQPFRLKHGYETSKRKCMRYTESRPVGGYSTLMTALKCVENLQL